ncbi:glycosyltransferase family 4 protein [Geobacter pelophilus]|uniref:Glycosyltransferase family 4 protein n=1 Tax=Geoanaerobacter pelophilus TaxID=60036 RepID=A0AAW4KYU4_9BACT|nr:glycosyltransferase family 4 protein [Geoanaerobacter pelophilus]MBT0662715.1 glycosyltransferase family 4 protein [Geoanaerobacter pelophilus]
MTEPSKKNDNNYTFRKKRILLVVRWPVGGIRTFMRYVYRRFEPKQYYFSILAPDNPELDLLEHDFCGLDFEIIKISRNPASSELFLAALKLLVRGKYDLVHSHGFTSGICTALSAYILRTPHILTSHDMLSSMLFKGVRGKLKLFVMWVTLKLVDAVHLVSNDAYTNLLQVSPLFEGIKDKCVVVTHGIETERFLNAVPRNLRNELGIDDDFFLIGFLGRFMSPKGFVYLVDAMELFNKSGNLPKKPLVLAFGEGGFIREEKAALAERGLKEYFIFLPFTDNVASVIKGLDLVVMPSIWEACGLLAMETLVAGTPLIASDCIGLREVVRDTPTHIVPTKDSNALGKEILFFMENCVKESFNEFVPMAAKRYDVTQQAFLIEKLMCSLMAK